LAFNKYHNITGSTGVDVELLAAGSGANNIKSIMLTNIHGSSAATVTLSLFKASTNKTYQILSTYSIAADNFLLLDNKALLSFDNSSSGYSLNITVGSSDTVDVFINT